MLKCVALSFDVRKAKHVWSSAFTVCIVKIKTYHSLKEMHVPEVTLKSLNEGTEAVLIALRIPAYMLKC